MAVCKRVTGGMADVIECVDGDVVMAWVMVWEYEGVVVFAGCLQCQSDVRERVDNAPKIKTGAVF